VAAKDEHQGAVAQHAHDEDDGEENGHDVGFGSLVERLVAAAGVVPRVVRRRLQGRRRVASGAQVQPRLGRHACNT